MRIARSRPALALLFVIALVAIVVPLLVSGSSSASAHARRDPSQVRITERDFSIKAPKVLRAGTFDLLVDNDGPDTHELIVTRADGKRLPLRPDGLTVDEEALESQISGSLEPGAPGSARRLHVHLTPGRYVLLCNMAGHYLGGMHATLLVR